MKYIFKSYYNTGTQQQKPAKDDVSDFTNILRFLIHSFLSDSSVSMATLTQGKIKIKIKVNVSFELLMNFASKSAYSLQIIKHSGLIIIIAHT